jgi:hypothetical protein
VTQRVALEVLANSLTNRRQRVAEEDDLVELFVIAQLPPFDMVSILLPPGSIDAGRLDMSTWIW